MSNHECDDSSKLIKLMIMLLLLLIMSPYEAESGSIVKYLPGFEGPLPFELETGYVGVGEEEEVQLFYYFIKSEKNPKENPLLLWLSGGPGCSSVSGLFLENGPVTFRVEGYKGGIPNLLSTTYSWTKVASIIFLDQPVGTGFSYSTTQLLDTPSDSGEVKLINQFLRKWLSTHIEFISNPFHAGGDSYSGKIIPAVVQEISKGNYVGLEPHINLQGYVLGNPSTDAEFEYNQRIPFAHGMALISDELYESLKRSCEGNYENVDPLNTECLKLVEEFEKCISGINIALIISPLCKLARIPRRNIEELFLANLSDVPSTHDCYSYTDLISSQWANDESVRKALHVKEGSIGRWTRCSMDLSYNHDIRSSVPYHLNNSIKGYRSLIYNGDHDMTISFVSTKAWIRSLNYSIIDYWRPWIINNQVAGFSQTYANNMTFATIKGGGHTAEYTPMEGFILFQRWISGQL